MDQESQNNVINNVLMPIVTIAGLLVAGLSIPAGVPLWVLYVVYSVLGLTAILMAIFLTAAMRRRAIRRIQLWLLQRRTHTDVEALWSELMDTFSTGLTSGVGSCLNSLYDKKILSDSEVHFIGNHIHSLFISTASISCKSVIDSLDLTASLLNAYFEICERVIERFNHVSSMKDHERRSMYRDLVIVRDHANRLKSEFLTISNYVNRRMGDRAVRNYIKNLPEPYQVAVVS